jgi:hypothetical protein
MARLAAFLISARSHATPASALDRACETCFTSKRGQIDRQFAHAQRRQPSHQACHALAALQSGRCLIGSPTSCNSGGADLASAFAGMRLIEVDNNLSTK